MVHVNAPSHTHSRRRAMAAALVFVVLPASAAGYYFGYHVGTVSIAVTDDAIDQFRSLNITFSQLQFHSSGALTLSEWVSVPVATTTIDLARLTDNTTQVLGAGTIQAGTYSQVRLVVDAASGELRDGTAVVVTVPSSELKTSTPFTLKAQGALTVLVRLQVTQAGGAYLLRPVFGGAAET